MRKGVRWTGHESIVHPWIEAAALFVVPVISSMLQMHSSNIFLHGSIFVKSAVSALLYEKRGNLSLLLCTTLAHAVLV